MLIRTQEKGFTLIEVMIAVAVIGILAVIALPAYQNYIARTEIDRCLKLITPARMTADSIIQVNNGSADNTVIANVAALGLSAGNDCENVSIANGNAAGNLDIVGVERGNTMRWRRTGANGTWGCTTTAGDANLAPQTCP